MKESDLMKQIMVAVSKEGHKIFRTNVGKVKLADGRWFDTGLPKGYPDLSGFTKFGRAIFIECKVAPYEPTEAQVRFLLMAIKYGCRAGVAFSVEQALKIVNLDLDEHINQVNYLRYLACKKGWEL